MIIYFGGIYNGKLDIVKKDTLVSEYFDISKNSLNEIQKFKVINNIDSIVKILMKANIDPLHYIKNLNLDDKIITFNINGNGVVPVEKFEREFRDACGNVYKYLIAKAEEVYKITYGLKERLK
ncbi:hypothetical protein CI105_02515 [Candidatus Izimaplasma bacterium ZiA1]|uniref:bifunctional adenosylcobinamide kinase/adenosylcobinamide-phosphate guanylyltransferase n=1 Tax=Candidatus Izimoplasma sp. ZiA1 TaxID=2024899 RepID=UPI000BAA3E30|nr:hypothetical protein CI105_02515 [Candidatus Izimaplasma bacterium ZiA1]